MENAVILGTFDGLHLGHRAVIENAKGYNIIAVTFKMPPKTVFDSSVGVLMSAEDRFACLKELGVSEIYALNFEEVCNIEPEDFLNIIYNRYKPSLFVCGFNYRFGKGAKGESETLRAFCNEKKIGLKVTESVKNDGVIVSSTLIREYISSGQIEKANRLLYKPFGFSADVIKGDKRGRTLGFPTINQVYPKLLQSVKFGVYESAVLIDNIEYKAISNIGIRPTFQTEHICSETYILNFNGDLYGKSLRVEPKRFLREERKFSSEDELKKAVLADIKSISP